MNDIICSHNGGNRPESSTTLFRGVRKVAAPVGRQTMSPMVEFARRQHRAMLLSTFVGSYFCASEMTC